MKNLFKSQKCWWNKILEVLKLPKTKLKQIKANYKYEYYIAYIISCMNIFTNKTDKCTQQNY